MMTQTIAVIDRNSLSLEALGGLLQELFPHEEICTYSTIDDYFHDCDRNFVQYFVSEDIMLNNGDEFEMLREITTVLSQGPGTSFVDAGYKVLNVFQPEKDVIADIVRLFDGRGDKDGRKRKLLGVGGKIDSLSEREREVLSLMARGYINKEIADKLNISTATAVFHRNNICEKLGTRSLGRLTLIAILSSLVKIDDV